MARIINAEAIQSAYRAKKRAAEEGGDDGDGDGKKRKKRRKEEESAAARNSLKIKPGESLKHFKRWDRAYYFYLSILVLRLIGVFANLYLFEIIDG